MSINREFYSKTLIVVVFLTSCEPQAQHQALKSPLKREGFSSHDKAQVKDTDTAHELLPSRGSSVPQHAVGNICTKLSAAQVRKVTGLSKLGTTGRYTFFGDGRRLLCSEPAAFGAGECEIIGMTTIKVEHRGRTFGLRSPKGVLTSLRYSPSGLSCVRRIAR